MSDSEFKGTHQESDFEYIRKIGQGAFGEVWKVQEKSSQVYFTLKKVNKSKISRVVNQFNRELENMYKVNHPSIAKLNFHFEDIDFLYLGIDPIEGLSLSQKLFIEKKFTQSNAAFYFGKVLEALSYLHSFNPPLVHKNINPENIIVDASRNIKLIDFLLVDLWEEPNTNSLTGNLEYIAPEIFSKGEYSVSFDIWCLGVLLCEMVYGKGLLKSGKKIGKIDFPIGEDCDYDLQDLIRKIVKKKPADRIAIEGIRQHPWMKKFAIDEKIEKKNWKNQMFYSSVVFLGTCRKKELENRRKTNFQIENLDTEIKYSENIVLRLEEKIKKLVETREKYVETINCLQVENDSSQVEIDEISEKNSGNILPQFAFLEKKFAKMQEKISVFSQISRKKVKIMKRTFSDFDDKTNLLSAWKNKLNESTAVEEITLNPGQNQLLDGDEKQLLNKYVHKYMNELKKNCENIRFKIEEANNLAFLKERGITELSILYKEKLVELSEKVKKMEEECKKKVKNDSNINVNSNEDKSDLIGENFSKSPENSLEFERKKADYKVKYI